MKLLILSDIHANWPALSAVLQAEPQHDDILCLGDLVDYGPHPLECVQWALNRLPSKMLIQGNHDWSVSRNLDAQCSMAYKHLATVTQKMTLARLPEAELHFLSSLWPQQGFELDGNFCFACHATPSESLFKYLTADAPATEWRREVECAGHPAFLFVGHTHLPMFEEVDGTIIVNPGSVGQPKDGDPRASYAVLEDGDVTIKRITYDVEATIRAYEKTPLKQEDVAVLAEVLRTGGTRGPTLTAGAHAAHLSPGPMLSSQKTCT